MSKIYNYESLNDFLNSDDYTGNSSYFEGDYLDNNLSNLLPDYDTNGVLKSLVQNSKNMGLNMNRLLSQLSVSASNAGVDLKVSVDERTNEVTVFYVPKNYTVKDSSGNTIEKNLKNLIGIAEIPKFRFAIDKNGLNSKNGMKAIDQTVIDYYNDQMVALTKSEKLILEQIKKFNNPNSNFMKGLTSGDKRGVQRAASSVKWTSRQVQEKIANVGDYKALTNEAWEAQQGTGSKANLMARKGYFDMHPLIQQLTKQNKQLVSLYRKQNGYRGLTSERVTSDIENDIMKVFSLYGQNIEIQKIEDELKSTKQFQYIYKSSNFSKVIKEIGKKIHDAHPYIGTSQENSIGNFYMSFIKNADLGFTGGIDDASSRKRVQVSNTLSRNHITNQKEIKKIRKLTKGNGIITQAQAQAGITQEDVEERMYGIIYSTQQAIEQAQQRAEQDIYEEELKKMNAGAGKSQRDAIARAQAREKAKARAASMFGAHSGGMLYSSLIEHTLDASQFRQSSINTTGKQFKEILESLKKKGLEGTELYDQAYKKYISKTKHIKNLDDIVFDRNSIIENKDENGNIISANVGYRQSRKAQSGDKILLGGNYERVTGTKADERVFEYLILDQFEQQIAAKYGKATLANAKRYKQENKINMVMNTDKVTPRNFSGLLQIYTNNIASRLADEYKDARDDKGQPISLDKVASIFNGALGEDWLKKGLVNNVEQLITNKDYFSDAKKNKERTAKFIGALNQIIADNKDLSDLGGAFAASSDGNDISVDLSKLQGATSANLINDYHYGEPGGKVVSADYRYKAAVQRGAVAAQLGGAGDMANLLRFRMAVLEGDKTDKDRVALMKQRQKETEDAVRLSKQSASKDFKGLSSTDIMLAYGPQAGKKAAMLNDKGQLIDENGNVITAKNDTGNYYIDLSQGYKTIGTEDYEDGRIKAGALNGTIYQYINAMQQAGYKGNVVYAPGSGGFATYANGKTVAGRYMYLPNWDENEWAQAFDSANEDGTSIPILFDKTFRGILSQEAKYQEVVNEQNNAEVKDPEAIKNAEKELSEYITTALGQLKDITHNKNGSIFQWQKIGLKHSMMGRAESSTLSRAIAGAVENFKKPGEKSAVSGFDATEQNLLNSGVLLNQDDLRQMLRKYTSSEGKDASETEDAYVEVLLASLHDIYEGAEEKFARQAGLIGKNKKAKEIGELTANQLENFLVNSVTFGTDEFERRRLAAGGKAIRGLMGEFGRFPLSNGMDIKDAEFYAGNDQRIKKGAMQVGLGLGKSVNADFDGDKLVVHFDMADSDAFNAYLGGLTGEERKKAANSLFSEKRKAVEYQKFISQAVGAAEIRDIADSDAKFAHGGKLKEDDIKTIFSEEAQSAGAILSRLNKGYTGRFSNNYQAIERTMEELTPENLATNSDKMSAEQKEKFIRQMMVRGVFEGFTQDAISAKKVTARIAKKTGSEVTDLSVLNELGDIMGIFSDTNTYKNLESIKSAFGQLGQIGLLGAAEDENGEKLKDINGNDILKGYSSERITAMIYATAQKMFTDKKGNVDWAGMAKALYIDDPDKLKNVLVQNADGSVSLNKGPGHNDLSSILTADSAMKAMFDYNKDNRIGIAEAQRTTSNVPGRVNNANNPIYWLGETLTSEGFNNLPDDIKNKLTSAYDELAKVVGTTQGSIESEAQAELNKIGIANKEAKAIEGLTSKYGKLNDVVSNMDAYAEKALDGSMYNPSVTTKAHKITGTQFGSISNFYDSNFKTFKDDKELVDAYSNLYPSVAKAIQDKYADDLKNGKVDQKYIDDKILSTYQEMYFNNMPELNKYLQGGKTAGKNGTLGYDKNTGTFKEESKKLMPLIMGTLSDNIEQTLGKAKELGIDNTGIKDLLSKFSVSGAENDDKLKKLAAFLFANDPTNHEAGLFTLLGGKTSIGTGAGKTTIADIAQKFGIGDVSDAYQYDEALKIISKGTEYGTAAKARKAIIKSGDAFWNATLGTAIKGSGSVGESEGYVATFDENGKGMSHGRYDRAIFTNMTVPQMNGMGEMEDKNFTKMTIIDKKNARGLSQDYILQVGQYIKGMEQLRDYALKNRLNWEMFQKTNVGKLYDGKITQDTYEKLIGLRDAQGNIIRGADDKLRRGTLHGAVLGGAISLADKKKGKLNLVDLGKTVVGADGNSHWQYLEDYGLNELLEGYINRNTREEYWDPAVKAAFDKAYKGNDSGIAETDQYLGEKKAGDKTSSDKEDRKREKERKKQEEKKAYDDLQNQILKAENAVSAAYKEQVSLSERYREDELNGVINEDNRAEYDENFKKAREEAEKRQKELDVLRTKYRDDYRAKGKHYGAYVVDKKNDKGENQRFSYDTLRQLSAAHARGEITDEEFRRAKEEDDFYDTHVGTEGNLDSTAGTTKAIRDAYAEIDTLSHEKRDKFDKTFNEKAEKTYDSLRKKLNEYTVQSSILSEKIKKTDLYSKEEIEFFNQKLEEATENKKEVSDQLDNLSYVSGGLLKDSYGAKGTKVDKQFNREGKILQHEEELKAAIAADRKRAEFTSAGRGMYGEQYKIERELKKVNYDLGNTPVTSKRYSALTERQKELLRQKQEHGKEQELFEFNYLDKKGRNYSKEGAELIEAEKRNAQTKFELDSATDEEKWKKADYRNYLATMRQGQGYYNRVADLQYSINNAEFRKGKETTPGKEQYYDAEIAELRNQLEEAKAELEAWKSNQQDSVFDGTTSHSKEDMQKSMQESANSRLALNQSKMMLGYKQSVLGNSSSGSYASNWMKRMVNGGAIMTFMRLLRQGMRQITNEAKQLDKAMTNLAIVTGSSREQARSLMTDYSKLGQELGATTLEVATSANEWLRQGYQAAEVSDLVTSSLYLSKLGMIDTTTATKDLTSALKGFKIEASDSMSIVDKLTSLDLKAATSAGDIAEGLAQFSNLASMNGVDIDQASAYVATIADVTQQSGNSVGMALKTIMSRYGNIKATAYGNLNTSSDTDDTSENLNDVEKVLKKIGISVRSSSLEFKDFDVVLDELAEKWQTLDNVSKNAIASAMAGTRQRESFVTLMENYDKYQDLLETSQNSSGTADKKYQSYQESLEASMNELTAAFQGLANDGQISELMKEGVDVLTKLVKHLPSIIKWASLIYFQIQNMKIGSGTSIWQQLGKTAGNLLATVFTGTNRMKGGNATQSGGWSALGGYFKNGWGNIKNSFSRFTIPTARGTNKILAETDRINKGIPEGPSIGARIGGGFKKFGGVVASPFKKAASAIQTNKFNKEVSLETDRIMASEGDLSAAIDERSEKLRESDVQKWYKEHAETYRLSEGNLRANIKDQKAAAKYAEEHKDDYKKEAEAQIKQERGAAIRSQAIQNVTARNAAAPKKLSPLKKLSQFTYNRRVSREAAKLNLAEAQRRSALTPEQKAAEDAANQSKISKRAKELRDNDVMAKAEELKAGGMSDDDALKTAEAAIPAEDTYKAQAETDINKAQTAQVQQQAEANVQQQQQASKASKSAAAGAAVSYAMNQVSSGVSAWMTSGTTHSDAYGNTVNSSESAKNRSKAINAIFTTAIPVVGGVIGQLVGDNAAKRLDATRDAANNATDKANKSLSSLEKVGSSVDNMIANIGTAEGANSAKELAQSLYGGSTTEEREQNAETRSMLEGYLEQITGNQISLYDATEKIAAGDEHMARELQLAQKKATVQETIKSKASALNENQDKIKDAYTDYRKANDNAIKTSAGQNWAVAGKTVGAATGTAVGVGLGTIGAMAAAGAAIGAGAMGIGAIVGAVVGVIAGTITAIVENTIEKDKAEEEAAREWNAKTYGDKMDEVAQNREYYEKALAEEESKEEDERNKEDIEKYETIIEQCDNMIDVLEDQQALFKEIIDEVDSLTLETAMVEATAASGEYITDLNVSQLKQLGPDQLISILAEAVEKEGGTLGYKLYSDEESKTVTEAAREELLKELKTDDEIASVISGQSYTLSEALALRNNPNYSTKNADGTYTDGWWLSNVLENFATGLGVAYEDLDKVNYGLLTFSEVASSAAEQAEEIDNLTSVMSEFTQSAGKLSDVLNTIITNYPELIQYTNDESELFAAMITKNLQLANAYIGSQYSSIASSTEYGDYLKKALGETTGSESWTFRGAKKDDGTYESLSLTEMLANNNITNLDSLTTWISNNKKKNGEYTEGNEDIEYLESALSAITSDYNLVSSQFKEMYDMAIEYQTNCLDAEINNLNEQKEALQEINSQREYENKLVEARLKLEDATKDKKRVYRAGVGWVYEADQESIKEAQENLDSVQNEKKISELDEQISILEQQKEELSSIYDEENAETLKNFYEEFTKQMGITGDNLNAIIDSLSTTGTISTSLNTLIENTISDSAGDKDTAIEELKGKWEALQAAVNAGDAEDYNTKLEEYSTAYTKAKNAGYVGGYGDTTMDNWGSLGDNTTYEVDNEGNVTGGVSGTYSHRNATASTIGSGGTSSYSVVGTKYFKVGDPSTKDYYWTGFTTGNPADQKFINDIYGDAKSGEAIIYTKDNLTGSYTSSGGVYGVKSSDENLYDYVERLQSDKGLDTFLITGYRGGDESIFVQNGVLWAVSSHDNSSGMNRHDGKLEDGDGMWFTNLPDGVDADKFALGTLDTSGDLALVNELGTEAIVTPSGTITALPSHTGVVPADITKNLWSLGEIAPNIMRVLSAQLYPDTIGQSALAAGGTDESVNISGLNMTINAQQGFNVDQFVGEIRSRVALTRNVKH